MVRFMEWWERAMKNKMEKIEVSGPTGIFEIEGKHIGIIDGKQMSVEEYYQRMRRRGYDGRL